MTSALVLVPACAFEAHAVPAPAAEREPSAEQALRCQIELPQDPGVELDALAVRVRRSSADTVEVRQDLSAPCNAGAQGWQFNYDLSAVRVCGQECDALRQDPGARIEIVVGER